MPWRKGKRIGMTEAIKRIGVSPERLRYWELKGIIAPAYERHGAKGLRRYSEEDIAIASEIKSANFWALIFGIDKKRILCLQKPYLEIRKAHWPY